MFVLSRGWSWCRLIFGRVSPAGVAVLTRLGWWGQQPPPTFGAPDAGWGAPPLPQQQMWQPPPAYPLAPDAYPVNVSYDRSAAINRLWGIPLLGVLVRGILLIPHFIVLMLLSFVVSILMMFMWVPVLFLGRQADLMYTLVGGFTRWGFRVGAYLFLMVDRYPPFSLGEDDPRL